MLNIDIDGVYRRSRFDKQKILYAMPRPFFIRLSSGKRGFHIRVPLCGEWDFRRYAYDDPMRVDLDLQRVRHGLPLKNLVFDVKLGKRAGLWEMIQTETDVERYLDRYNNGKDYNIILTTDNYGKHNNSPEPHRHETKQTRRPHRQNHFRKSENWVLFGC
jgi:hypothetical protein